MDIKSGFKYMSSPDFWELQVLNIKKDTLLYILQMHEYEKNFLAMRSMKRYLYLKRVRNEARKERLQKIYKE